MMRSLFLYAALRTGAEIGTDFARARARLSILTSVVHRPCSTCDETVATNRSIVSKDGALWQS